MDTLQRTNKQKYGYKALTGRAAYNQYDYDIWMQIHGSVPTLRIRLGLPWNAALAGARGAFELALRDVWNVPDIFAGDMDTWSGAPKLSSHYGTHLTIFHIPLALSGQVYSAVRGTLTFAPAIRLPTWSLPVMIPGGWAELKKGLHYTLCVSIGEVVVKSLMIDGVDYGAVSVAALRKAPPVCKRLTNPSRTSEL